MATVAENVTEAAFLLDCEDLELRWPAATEVVLKDTLSAILWLDGAIRSPDNGGNIR